MTASISRYRQQTGSILVQFALLLGIIVAILGVLDIGYMYYAKRELQRTADLAALSAVQAIDFGENGETQRALRCELAGVESLNANWLASSPIAPVLPIAEFVSCGEWNPRLYDGPEYFLPSANKETNAARVSLEGRSPAFFPAPWSRVVVAQAIAKRGEPIATVLVRSTLTSLNAGMLNTLLSAVLGTQVNLTAVSWQGIAKLNVNLLKVFDSLLDVNANIGDYEALLNTQVKLADLLKAMITAIEPGKFMVADVAALQQLAFLSVGNVEVRLGDLIKLENTNPAAALNLGVNALELIQGALQVATKNNAVNLNLGIPGLATAKLKVIEPAQLAIIGNPLGDSITIEARTAQVRLWVAFNASINPLSSVLDAVSSLIEELLKLVLGLLSSTKIDPKFLDLSTLRLDVLLDTARGYARIDNVDCTSPMHSMNLTVEKAAVDVHVGQLTGTTFALREQQAFGASIPQVQTVSIIDIGSRKCNLLGLLCGKRLPGTHGDIQLGGHLKVLSEQQKMRFSGDEINKFAVIDDMADQHIYHTVLPESISSISGLVKGANLIEVNIGTSVTGEQKLSLVNELLQNVLTPVLSILDPLAPLLDGLLHALGIQVNQIEVAPYLQCGGSSELVY